MPFQMFALLAHMRWNGDNSGSSDQWRPEGHCKQHGNKTIQKTRTTDTTAKRQDKTIQKTRQQTFFRVVTIVSCPSAVVGCFAMKDGANNGQPQKTRQDHTKGKTKDFLPCRHNRILSMLLVVSQ
jgi:hypothetical protein